MNQMEIINNNKRKLVTLSVSIDECICVMSVRPENQVRFSVGWDNRPGKTSPALSTLNPQPGRKFNSPAPSAHTTSSAEWFPHDTGGLGFRFLVYLLCTILCMVA